MRLNNLTFCVVVALSVGCCYASDASDEAVKKSKTASASQRADARQLFSRAFDDFQAQNFKDAAALLRAGLEIDPADYRAQMLFAQASDALGKAIEAEQAYRLTRDLAPPNSIEYVKAGVWLESRKSQIARSTVTRSVLKIGETFVLRITGSGEPSTIKSTIIAIDADSYTRETSGRDGAARLISKVGHDGLTAEVRFLDSDAKGMQSFTRYEGQPIRKYPFSVGESWQGTSTTVTKWDDGRPEHTTRMRYSVRAVKTERIETPLGNLDTIVLVEDLSWDGGSSSVSCWYSIEHGTCVMSSSPNSKSVLESHTFK